MLSLALPLMISMGSWSVMLFVDRTLLLWHSPEAISAALPAGVLYWSVTAFLLGTSGYVSTFVAQYYGAGQPQRIGAVVWQAMWIGIVATPLYLLLAPAAPLLFAWAGHDPAVARQEVIYFCVLLWSAGANVLAAAQAGFFSGRGHTRVVMLVDVGAVIINIVLDVLLIHGLLGLPRMGIAGAGLATVIAMWSRVLVYGWLMRTGGNWEEFGLGSTARLDIPLMRRLLLYGAPSGLQLFVEAGSFAILTMLMGRFGTVAMTASTLALNINVLAVIPMAGLGVATSIAVGQQLTRGRTELAVRASWSSFTICLVYTLSFGSLYLLAPDLLLAGYAVGLSVDEFGQIRELTVVLLRFVAVFCVMDGMQMVISGAIKGAGDTWFVLRATLATSLVAIAACWQETPWGLMWWWFVLTVWVALMCLIFGARFLGGRWKTMRVIEREFTELEPAPAIDAV